jgi:predicted nucleotidyltransferase
VSQRDRGDAAGLEFQSGEGMKSFQKLSLVKREREAIQSAVQVLRDKFSLEKVILFGSRARGDYDEHSDIDLLIVSSQKLHWREEKAVEDALFDLGMEYDVIFSPLFVSTGEWETDVFRQFPLYREIMKDGALVA